MRGRQKYRQSRQQAVTAFSSTCSSLGWNYISSDCQSSSSETCSSLDKMSGIRKNKIRNGIQGKAAASVSCRCRGNRPQSVSSREFVLSASDQLWFSSRLGLGPPAQPQPGLQVLQGHSRELHPPALFSKPLGAPLTSQAPRSSCELSPPPASPQGTPRASVKPWELWRPSQCRTPSSGGSRAQPGLVPQSSARRDPSPAPESQFHPQSRGVHVLKENKCPNWTMPEENCFLVAWGRAHLDFALLVLLPGFPSLWLKQFSVADLTL